MGALARLRHRWYQLWPMGMREAPLVKSRMSDELRARLYRYAQASGRSIQWIVNESVTRFLDRAEREDTLARSER